MGAWIETVKRFVDKGYSVVAPRVGAWIETVKRFVDKGYSVRRTPCGCVD